VKEASLGKYTSHLLHPLPLKDDLTCKGSQHYSLDPFCSPPTGSSDISPYTYKESPNAFMLVWCFGKYLKPHECCSHPPCFLARQSNYSAKEQRPVQVDSTYHDFLDTIHHRLSRLNGKTFDIPRPHNNAPIASS